jgi:PKD repeat protein
MKKAGYLQGGFWGVMTVAAMATVFCCTGAAHAAAPAVVINEIMWDGVEYIELFNTTADTVSLTGWALTRQQVNADVKMIVTFGDDHEIAGNAYFLIAKNATATTATVDVLVSGLVLVNDPNGELVTLKNEAGVIIDQVNQTGEWFAGENTTDGVAMERRTADSVGTDAAAWQTAFGTLNGRNGTPGAANSTPPPNTAPMAELSGPTSGLVGTSLTFSAEDSGDTEDDELTFTWSFGDGTASTGVEATHSFTAAGTYTVAVTVSDEALEATASQSVSITAPSYSDSVVINEALPDPVGSDTAAEFIELFNTASSSVDLSGWQLDDADGGSAPHTLPAGTTINGRGFLSILRSSSGLAFNNEGDTVRLLDPAHSVKASFTYSDSTEGQSWNRTEGGSYVVSTTLTPGVANVITAPSSDGEEEEEDDDEETASVSTSRAGRVAGTQVVTVALADVREESPGTLVSTEGVVSAPPGLLGKGILYLAGSGIQVYAGKGEYPALKVGDKVKVTGELSSLRGETRLKLAQATDIVKASAGEAPSAHVLETGEIDEETEGWLVTIQGKVTETSGDTFYVDDGSGEVKIYIKPTTQIDKPKMKQGTAVTITGIVSETDSGFRILPRFQEDVRLGLVAGLTSFPATGSSVSAALFGWWVLVSLLLWLAWRSQEPLLSTILTTPYDQDSSAASRSSAGWW